MIIIYRIAISYIKIIKYILIKEVIMPSMFTKVHILNLNKLIDSIK